jgi:hypothetical protein
MDSGELRRKDPEAVAIEFYSPIYLLLHACGSLEEARPAIRVHIEQFLKNYRRGRMA